MPIIFKYKNPINLSYAPGIVTSGSDGDTGKSGNTGISLYFSDFEFNNSYDIELGLQKIENNYILSSDNFLKLPDGHAYKENDLILSNTGKCYRIISSNISSTFKNYTYDIECIGYIQKHDSPQVSYIEIENITGTAPNYNSVQNIIGKGHIKDQDGIMRGNWYRITLVGTENSVDHFISVDKESVSAEERSLIEKLYKSLFGIGDETVETDNSEYYRYSLEIKLKNTKSFVLNGYPTEPNSKLNFYKSLKYSNLDLCKKETVNPDDTVDTSNSFVSTKEIFISDNLLDRLHPSDNDIPVEISSFDNSKSMWRNSGVRSDNYTKDYLNFVKDPACNEHITKLSDSHVFIERDFNNQRYDNTGYKVDIHGHSVNNLPVCSAGKLQDIDSSADIYLNMSNDEYTQMIQNVTNNVDSANPGKGSSVYFSSLSDQDIYKHIDDFVFSSDNEFIITIKNLRTKEISYMEVPVLKKK